MEYQDKVDPDDVKPSSHLYSEQCIFAMRPVNCRASLQKLAHHVLHDRHQKTCCRTVMGASWAELGERQPGRGSQKVDALGDSPVDAYDGELPLAVEHIARRRACNVAVHVRLVVHLSHLAIHLHVRLHLRHTTKHTSLGLEEISPRPTATVSLS